MADEFIKLKRKTPVLKVAPIVVTPVTKKPKEKSNQPKFKKGSWKHWLYKKLKKMYIPKSVEKFHDTKLENYVIYSDTKPRLMISSSKLTKSTIEKLEKKYKNPYLLINSGEDMFTKVSLDSYKKLLGIDKIIIQFEFSVTDDGEDPYTVDEQLIQIDSINKLFYYLNGESFRIGGLYELQAKISFYSMYDIKHKIMVHRKDGTVETYKNDINKFIKAYGLRLI